MSGELLALALVNLVAVAVAWGKLSAQVQANRDHHDARTRELERVLQSVRAELSAAHARIDRLLERLAHPGARVP